MKKTAVLIFAILLIAFAVSPASGRELPRPRGYVNDFANIIDSQRASQIEAACSSIQKSTGVQIAVVTIDSLGAQSIDEAAYAFYKEWGIGEKGKDNGVLILVAKKDREVRIEPGYGLEGVLPDGLAGEIIRYDVIPRFRQGDYGAGLLAAVYKIGKIVGGQVVTYPQSPRHGTNIGGLIYLIFFLFIILSSFIGRRRGRLGGLGALWFLTGFGLGGSMRGGGFSGGRSGGFSSFGGFGGGMSGGGGASGSW
jgi:uncharacterized protein